METPLRCLYLPVNPQAYKPSVCDDIQLLCDLHWVFILQTNQTLKHQVLNSKEILLYYICFPAASLVFPLRHHHVRSSECRVM